MKISIIGIGSLGGFLARDLCDIEFVNSIELIDYDIVHNRNIKNSIYRKNEIGLLKTHALFIRLTKDFKNKISVSSTKYQNNNIKFSNSDLIIDCTDMMNPYDKQISCKCYISGAHLIIDCKRDMHSNLLYEGRYSYNIDRGKIKKAALSIAELIESKKINDMILKSFLYKFDLYTMEKTIMHENDLCSNKLTNCIYDSRPELKAIKNFDEMGNNLLKYNMVDDIYLKYPRSNSTFLVKKNTLTLDSFANLIKPIINFPLACKVFCLNITYEKKKIMVELIPNEPGA